MRDSQSTPRIETPVLEARNIGLSYADKPVLQGIDFALNQGDFVAVLGDSGCGKSSLLQLLAGFLRPTSGEVLLDGTPMHAPNAHVGVVFQKPPLYPWLTLFDNVAFGLRLQKLPAAVCSEQANRFLRAVGLAESASLYPYQCSGGMCQKAFLARTLCCNPRVILADEPFSALDAFSKASLQKLLRELWFEFKSTIFLITHDIDEALKLATRILLLKPFSVHRSNIVQNVAVDFTSRFENDDMERDRDYMDIKQSLLHAIHSRDLEYRI